MRILGGQFDRSCLIDRSYFFFSFFNIIWDRNAEDQEAFDVLFCIAFQMMDAQWLAMHASYMQFNVRNFIYFKTKFNW